MAVMQLKAFRCAEQHKEEVHRVAPRPSLGDE